MDLAKILYIVNQHIPCPSYMVLDKPVIENKTRKIDYDKIKSMQFSKDVERFINVMKKSFSYEELINFYSRINELKINVTNESDNSYSNYYDVLKNEMFLDQKMGKDSIYHELFHLTSSITKDENVFCGFSQCNKDMRLGDGLTEGYTQILRERYFGNPSYGSRKNGQIEKIANFTEMLIGKDEMTELYLTADLKGLIEKLSKYSTESDVMKFIAAVDTIDNSKLLTKEEFGSIVVQRMLLKSFKIIKIFLINAYAKKCLNEVKKDCKRGQIIEKSLNNFIEEVMKDNVLVNIKTGKETEILSQNDLLKDLKKIRKLNR